MGSIRQSGGETERGEREASIDRFLERETRSDVESITWYLKMERIIAFLISFQREKTYRYRLHSFYENRLRA
jgi:hypothetical protein